MAEASSIQDRGEREKRLSPFFALSLSASAFASPASAAVLASVSFQWLEPFDLALLLRDY